MKIWLAYQPREDAWMREWDDTDTPMVRYMSSVTSETPKVDKSTDVVREVAHENTVTRKWNGVWVETIEKDENENLWK